MVAEPAWAAPKATRDQGGDKIQEESYIPISMIKRVKTTRWSALPIT